MASDDDGCRQLLVHPTVWDWLVETLDSRGIGLTGPVKFSEDDLPTYVMTPKGGVVSGNGG